MPENARVNHPTHYNLGSIEVIDAIEGLELSFCKGNALKYIARHASKGGAEDLHKAIWYVKRILATKYGEDNETKKGG